MPLYIKWLFKGAPISEAMGVSITKVGKRVSILTIESISAYNAGKYICKAENSAGMAMYATELIVKGYLQKFHCIFIHIFYFYFHPLSILPQNLVFFLKKHIKFYRRVVSKSRRNSRS